MCAWNRSVGLGLQSGCFISTVRGGMGHANASGKSQCHENRGFAHGKLLWMSVGKENAFQQKADHAGKLLKNRDFSL
ncbi:MAG: hypothetical protein LBL69_00890, partial [Zoogloeaceae bacterium]|nr:hypothetical protein [Zoogloeaceae bacterium]